MWCGLAALAGEFVGAVHRACGHQTPALTDRESLRDQARG
jgi:hypothetical protein